MHFDCSMNKTLCRRRKTGALVDAPVKGQKLKRACRSIVLEPNGSGGLTKVWIAGNTIVADASRDATGAKVQIVKEVEGIDANLELGILTQYRKLGNAECFAEGSVHISVVR